MVLTSSGGWSESRRRRSISSCCARACALIARDTKRQLTRGKVAYRDGFTPAINDVHVTGTRRDLGLWLDTSEQMPEASVDEILQRTGEAIVR